MGVGATWLCISIHHTWAVHFPLTKRLEQIKKEELKDDILSIFREKYFSTNWLQLAEKTACQILFVVESILNDFIIQNQETPKQIFLSMMFSSII